MRRRQIEQAKLQDQNIKLEEQSCRQQATLNAHLRFIARADSHQGKQHKSLQHELQSTQQDLQQVERQLQTTLATLEQCQHDNATYKQQIDALKATTDDLSTDAHKEELLQISLIYDQEKLHLVAQLQQMKTELLEATKRNRQDATTEGQKATTEVTDLNKMQLYIEDLKNELREALNKEKQGQTDLSIARQHSQTFEDTIQNLNREIDIKDKQLKHLRGQLYDMSQTGSPSFLSLAVMGGGGGGGGGGGHGESKSSPTSRTSKEEAQLELIEILEDDMKNMKGTYEKRILEMEMEIERLGNK